MTITLLLISAVAICLGGWAITAGQLWRQLRRLRRAQAQGQRRLQSARARARYRAQILAQSPGAHTTWDRAGSSTTPKRHTALHNVLGIPPQCPTSKERVAACFIKKDHDRLLQALTQTRTRLHKTRLHLRHQDHRLLYAAVVQEADGSTVLWLWDASDAQDEYQRCTQELAGWQRFYHNLPMPLWRRDRQGRLISSNARYCQAVSFPEDKVAQQQIELIGRAYAADAREMAARARAQGQVQQISRHAVIQGQRRLFDLYEIPFAHGGTLGIGIDRAQLEEVQAQLARHQSSFRDVLERLSSGIAIFDRTLTLRFHNSAYRLLWDLSEDELSSTPKLGELLDLLRARRRLPEQADFRSYKRAQLDSFSTLVEPWEELLHLPNGRTLRLVAQPHPQEGVLLCYDDISERLELEASLSTLSEIQNQTFRHLYEAVAVYGADGRLRLYNPAFVRMWGLQDVPLDSQPHISDLVQSLRHWFLLSEEQWAPLADRIIANASEPRTANGRIERSDHSVILWNQVPLPDGAALYTYSDITASERVQEALRARAQAVETADRLKSEFLASVSSQLRTPLNSIIGFAEILEARHYGALNPRQLDYSRAIVESARQLMAIIDDILDLASIQAGYMRLQCSWVSLPDLLAAVYRLGSERATNRGLELILSAPSDISEIECDPQRIKQALFNLLSNALKHTKRGGRITISAAACDDGRSIELAITDTGTGISQKAQGSVLEAFAHGDGDKTGPGIGLSLAKSLFELHGGRLTLSSSVGIGTRVTCVLPRRVSSEHQEPAAPLPSPRENTGAMTAETMTP